MITLPAGAHGRLAIVYRPWWLLLGGALAGASLLVLLSGAWRALRG